MTPDMCTIAIFSCAPAANIVSAVARDLLVAQMKDISEQSGMRVSVSGVFLMAAGLGAVMALVATMVTRTSLAMPIGFALWGPISDLVGVDTAFVAAAIVSAAAKLGPVAVPEVRNLRRADVPPSQARQATT